MRTILFITALTALTGCSTHGVVHHSPYDLNRDGVLDARCPGVEYDTGDNTLYAWRSRASGHCADEVALGVQG